MGILLDGLDPQKEWGLIFLRDHYHPATPEMRNRTMAIPGMSGEWDFGSERGPKPFNLPFGFIEYDRFTKQRKLNDFVAFLFDAYGRPRSIKLIFDYEPDKYYDVKLSTRIDPERLFRAIKFYLPLIANKPEKKFLIKSNEITMGSDIPIMSDVLLGSGITDWKVISPQSFRVSNSGSLVIPFSFVVEGTGTNVTFTANERTLSLGTFTNKRIELTDNYVAKLNGVEDLTSTNGVFLELLPGVNTITVNGTNLNLTVSESLTYLYI